jgi:hypothetical protein
VIRLLYRGVLRLHPPWFRRRFAEEMLWIFDQHLATGARAGLLAEGAVSIVRQWALRSAYWRESVTLQGAAPSSEHVPQFFTFGTSLPSRTALTHGAILSAALFAAIAWAVSENPGRLRFSLPRVQESGGAVVASYPTATRMAPTPPRGWWSRLREFFQSAPRREPPLPDTPAGRQLGEWLRAYNAADAAAMRAAGDVTAAAPRADAWAQWRERHGRLDVLQVEQAGPGEVAVIAQSQDGQRWRIALGPPGMGAPQMMQLFPSVGAPARDILPAASPVVDHVAKVADALLALFDTADIVALGEWHATQEDFAIRTKLIHHAGFPGKVQNIVVECGNARQQAVLDRFIRGEEVSRLELQAVWRDTTESPVGGCDSFVYEQFLHEVRSVNRRKPEGPQIRVLAGDPPIDWAKVKSRRDFAAILARRDSFAAELIAREVLAKAQKALVVYGAGHLWRKQDPPPNLAALIDKDFPGRLTIVIRLGGADLKVAGGGRPLFLPLKESALGTLNAGDVIGKIVPPGLTLGDIADACIYSGPNRDTLVQPDPATTADRAYLKEKERRRRFAPSGKQRDAERRRAKKTSGL